MVDTPLPIRLRVARGLLAVAAALGCVSAGPAQPAATLPTTAPAGEVDRWVEALADPDPAARDDAGAHLMALGPGARAALAEAMRSAEPQVRARAAALLSDLPWFLPEDPPAVRGLLKEYSTASPETRASVAQQLARLPKGEGLVALLRLMEQDSNEEVAWAVVHGLRDHVGDPDLVRLHGRTFPLTRTADFALAGWVVRYSNPPAAARYFRRALTEDYAHPGGASAAAEIRLMVEELQAIYSRLGAHDEAADVLRQELKQGRFSSGSDRRKGIRDLFALHATFGPLKGYPSDTAEYRLDLRYADSLYVAARLAGRMGHPRLAALFSGVAYLAGGLSPQDRFDTGEFLLRRLWYDLARREFEATVALPSWLGNTTGVAGGEARRFNAHVRLAAVANQTGRHMERAEHLRAAVESMERHPLWSFTGIRDRLVPRDIDNLRVHMHWAFLDGLRQAGETEALRPHVDALVRLEPVSAELTLEVVPLLKAWGRDTEARAFYERAYAKAKGVLDLRGTPEQMNRVAWLSARCGERLEEAKDLADAAVAAQPQNPAFLDTAAEVRFRLGDVDGAIALETKAASLQPLYPFFQQQVRRFRAGK